MRVCFGVEGTNVNELVNWVLSLSHTHSLSLSLSLSLYIYICLKLSRLILRSSHVTNHLMPKNWLIKGEHTLKINYINIHQSIILLQYTIMLSSHVKNPNIFIFLSSRYLVHFSSRSPVLRNSLVPPRASAPPRPCLLTATTITDVASWVRLSREGELFVCSV